MLGKKGRVPFIGRVPFLQSTGDLVEGGDEIANLFRDPDGPYYDEPHDSVQDILQAVNRLLAAADRHNAHLVRGGKFC